MLARQFAGIFSGVMVQYLFWDVGTGGMSIVCVTEVHAVVILERDDYNYFLPGLIAVCDGNKIKKNGYHGAPDLVAEVVSISSRSLDYIRKPVKYEQAGVREYWIVDPLRNVVMVYDFEAVGGGGVNSFALPLSRQSCLLSSG